MSLQTNVNPGTVPKPGEANYKPGGQPVTIERITEALKKITSSVEGLSQPALKVPEPVSDIKSAQTIFDKTPATWLEEQEQRRQGEIERLDKEREAAKEERTGLKDKLGDFFKGLGSAEDKVREEREALGVPESLKGQQTAIENIKRLSESAVGLMTQRDNALAAMGQQAIATPFITGQQSRVADAYDRRINTLGAQAGVEQMTLQLLQGQVEQARGLVSDIVNAYTYDTQMELQRHTMFLDLNSEEIAGLDAEYQNALKDSQRYWENLYNEERADKEMVLNSMIQFPKAGISANDTPEMVARKISSFIGVQPDADVKQLALQFPGVVGLDMNLTEALTAISQMPQIGEAPKTFGTAAGGYYTWVSDGKGGWTAQRVTAGVSPGVPPGDEPIKFSSVTERVLNDLLKVSDMTASERGKWQTDIIAFNMRANEPQGWFIQRMQEETGYTYPKATMQGFWDDFKKRTGITKTTFPEQVTSAFQKTKDNGLTREEGMTTVLIKLAEAKGYSPSAARKIKLSDFPAAERGTIEKALESVYGKEKGFLQRFGEGVSFFSKDPVGAVKSIFK